MALLNVNPTRMELLKLRRKLKTAKRGHKLLKDKRDGLMKHFMIIIKSARAYREKVENSLGAAFKSFLFAASLMSEKSLHEALSWPTKNISLSAKKKNVMSVLIPEFSYKEAGNHFCYSLASTPSDIDSSLDTFAESLQDMVKLAEIEHSAKLLAIEIEKTRRRVNALEYVFIPQIEDTISYIEAKLSELERGALVTLMKVKEIITALEG